MSIRELNSLLVFEWAIAPTGSPPVKADFDIRLVLPNNVGSYTNDGIGSYIAPTATTRGKVTYTYKICNLGRHQITLTIGTDAVHIVEAHREVYCVVPPDYVINGTNAKLTQGPEIAPRNVTYDAKTSEGLWTTTERLDCFGYDGAERIMLFGRDDPGIVRKMFTTSPDLEEPTAYWNQTDLPGVTWSGSWQIDYATYSPLLDTWVIAVSATGGAAWVCTGDPLLIGSWSYITPPTQWTGAGFTNIMNIVWDPGLQLFMMWASTNNFAGRDMRVSPDGVTWYNQDAYQSFTVGSDTIKGQCFDYKRIQLNGETFTMFSQNEVYAWKKDDVDGTGLPDGATGWAQLPQDNGVIEGIGVRALWHIASDGSQIVVAHSGSINNAVDPSGGSASWGALGNSNTGWSDADLEWVGANGAIQVLLYLPQYVRPWILYHSIDGWLDATSIPQVATRNGTNNPEFVACTAEPFATFNTNFAGDPNYIPLTKPVGAAVNIGQYYINYDADNVFGLDGWGMIYREDFLDRSLDFIVFQRPSVLEFS